MKKTRRRFTTAFKTKVVLEALKERSALQELAKRFELSPVQIAQWKKEFLANAEKAFAGDSVEKDDRITHLVRKSFSLFHFGLKS